MMSRFYGDYLKVITRLPLPRSLTSRSVAPGGDNPSSSRCVRQVKKDEADRAAESGGFFGFFGRPKLDLRAFIAQMATGEGKSIVIAMLAVFMIQVMMPLLVSHLTSHHSPLSSHLSSHASHASQLHGLRVHVLENNEGLLDRDFATYKPFFEAFGIKCGAGVDDLLDPDCQVVIPPHPTLLTRVSSHGCHPLPPSLPPSSVCLLVSSRPWAR